MKLLLIQFKDFKKNCTKTLENSEAFQFKREKYPGLIN